MVQYVDLVGVYVFTTLSVSYVFANTAAHIVQKLTEILDLLMVVAPRRKPSRQTV